MGSDAALDRRAVSGVYMAYIRTMPPYAPVCAIKTELPRWKISFINEISNLSIIFLEILEKLLNFAEVPDILNVPHIFLTFE